MRKRLLALLLAIVSAFCFLFASCNFDLGNNIGIQTPKTDEEKITATVNKFVDEYNDGDFEGVLECMEPKIRNTMRALFNLLGGIAGGKLGVDINLADLFSLGVGINDGDFINFDIQDIAIGEGKASVTAFMNLAPATAETMYIILVEEDGEWLIQDITDKKNSIGSGKQILVKTIEEFVDGYAKIVYEQNGENYWGIINQQGELVYSQEGFLYYNGWNHLGDGFGWANIYGNEYAIINTKGEIVLTSSKFGFDKILCGGNGLIWVYKYQTDINGAKHLYGVLNTKGEWVVPMHELDFAYNDSYLSMSTYMLGEEWFVYYYYTGNRSHYQLYNYKTDATFLLGNMAGEIDGCIYFHNYHIYDEYWNETYYEYACILPDGSVEEAPQFTSVSNGKLIYEFCEYDYEINDTVNYFSIYDVKTDTKVIYDDYSTNMVQSIDFVDEYALVTIRGLDYNYYFTLIDENGVQQFEPIMYYAVVTYQENRIIYQATQEGMYIVADTQGNIIIPESAGYSYIGEYSNGLTVAQIAKTEDWVVIDKQGNVVLDSFCVNN